MSEFSENYHLRSENRDDACDLLRSVGLPGYVYPVANGWVTFVAKGGTFEPDPRIVSASPGPLLHYVFAEDHGWGFTLFDDGKIVSVYYCGWDEDIIADDSLYSRDALLRVVPSAGIEALDAFEEQLHPIDSDEFDGSEPAELFAKAVGLTHYRYLAFRYDDRSYDQAEEQYRDVVKII